MNTLRWFWRVVDRLSRGGIMRSIHTIIPLITLILSFHTFLFAGLAQGTHILTPKGQVPIESLSAGNILTGYDPETKSFPDVAIKSISVHTTQQLVTITTDNGVVSASPQQQFYEVTSEDFLAAQELNSSSILFSKKFGALYKN